MSEDWSSLFGDMELEGDGPMVEKTVIDLSPEDATKYITLGLYYEVCVMKERLKEKLEIAKAKVAKLREDDDLGTLRTRVEHAVMLQQKLKELTNAGNELFLQIQENEWL